MTQIDLNRFEFSIKFRKLLLNLNASESAVKERCRLTVGNPPTSGSSMKHFFLKRGPNPKNFCCLGQSSIS
jgi:hypothetical protein